MSETRRTVDSPVGPLTFVAGEHGLRGLYMDEQRHLPARVQQLPVDDSGSPEAVRQLAEYFAGGRTEFDLRLDLVGTPFQRLVWQALLEIPYGSTSSYGELALSIGASKAARAVGLANGRNPVGIVVPCHRVVGATGKLIGYGGGIERKRLLLDLEKRRLGGQLLLA